jgi:hypothetical protein
MVLKFEEWILSEHSAEEPESIESIGIGLWLKKMWSADPWESASPARRVREIIFAFLFIC